MPEARTRMTRQRAEILAELRKAKDHPTADEIHARVRRKLPRISLGTVYRNLELLAQAGEIQKLEGGQRGRRYDADVSPHLHVRCLACGRIADVGGAALAPRHDGLVVEGFAILRSRLELEGLCDECSRACPGSLGPSFAGLSLKHPEPEAPGGPHE